MRSVVLRVNPLAQLSVGLFSLLGSFWVDSLPVALTAIGAYALAAVLLLPGWRYPLVCLAFTSIAATAGLRIVVLAWPGSVMAGYVDPSRLADYLAQTLRLPARLIAALAAALQRFTGFGLAWQQLERVRRVRGFGAGRNPWSNGRHAANMSFALLVQAMRGATSTSIAMDARGFATASGRTWALPAPWTRLDSGGLVVAVVLGAVPVIARVVS